MHLVVPFAPQHSARPQVRRTPGRIHGALPCVLRRHRTVEQTLALAVQITQYVGLQPIRQNAEQEMAGQLGVWSPPEYVMPMASKPPTSRSCKRAISPSSVFWSGKVGPILTRDMGSGRLALGLARLVLAAFHASDLVDPDAVHLLRPELELEALVHHAGKESAH